MDKIKYYRVARKNNRAYWCPTKRMKRFGFGVVALGFDGPESRALAQEWNDKWISARKETRERGLGRRPEPDRQYVEADSEKQYIYFLRIGERIKIGVSRAPFSRLNDLCAAAADRFMQVLIVRGDRSDEQKLHRRFRAYRRNGEWFVAARPLQLTMIRCAAAGAVIHDEVEPQTKISNFAVESRLESQPSLGGLNA